MNAADFLSWLKDWLIRHPLRQPDGGQRETYIKEVMARIRASESPAPGVVRWLAFPRPRVVFALGTAAVCGVALVVLLHRAPAQIARGIEPRQPAVATSAHGRHTRSDLWMVAESNPHADEDAWISQTLKLLDELDEEPQVSSDDKNIEDWLKELKALDDAEIASS